MKHHTARVYGLFLSGFLSFCQLAHAGVQGVAIPVSGEIYKDQKIRQVALDLRFCVRERAPRFMSVSHEALRNGAEPGQQGLASDARQLIYYGNDRLASAKTVALLTSHLFHMHPNFEPLMVSDGKIRRTRVYLSGYEKALGEKTPDGDCVCSVVLPTARISRQGDFVEEAPLVSEKFVLHMKAAKIIGITTAAQIEMEAPFALALKMEDKIASDWLSAKPKDGLYHGPRWISATPKDKGFWYQSAVSDWKSSLAKTREISAGK